MDLLLLADPHLQLLGRDAQGRTVTMSDACLDVANFSKLSDDFVLKSIQHSSGPELAAARRLVNRITTRNLYRLVGDLYVSESLPTGAQLCRKIGFLQNHLGRKRLLKKENVNGQTQRIRG